VELPKFMGHVAQPATNAILTLPRQGRRYGQSVFRMSLSRGVSRILATQTDRFAAGAGNVERLDDLALANDFDLRLSDMLMSRSDIEARDLTAQAHA
jgi:hypothetical protein